MKILYFAWVREKIGKSQEELEIPDAVKTVADLILWLETKGPEYEAAFANKETINSAINQSHVDHSTQLNNANEIAFFPPVTGG
ncbi:MAG: molybdopterin converting factor subunit 1 [Rhizobiales bacterium]|nr:molybdopterin converting factor subunit 1 [Hyphomicrobiales bacterium]